MGLVVGLKLERYRPKLEASWVLTVWAVVGLQILVIFHLSTLSSLDDSVPLHFSLRSAEIVLGFEDRHGGAILPLLVADTLIVGGLWAANRGARRTGRARLAQLCVTTALAVALVGWLAFRLQRAVLRSPALSWEIEQVFELDPGGSYRERLP